MIQGLKVAAVIPAYRVGREIAGVVAAVPPEVDSIVVVNDASPDDLSRVLDQLADPRLVVLTHEKNQGVGGATVTGMLAALELGCDVVVKCDGDGQMDPAQIALLVEPLACGWADHAKGSRFHHGRELRKMPRLRFFGNVILTFLTKLASGYWNILDPVNGFFATRADVLRTLPLHRLARRYFFESDLLIQLNIQEARVADVPLPAKYGDEPSSLSPVRVAFDFPPRLIGGLIKRLFWRYVFYDVSPVAVFGLLGSISSIAGLGFGIYQWIVHYRNEEFTPPGTVVIVTLLLIFGFELLLQALVLDIHNTPRPGRREDDVHRRRSFAARS